MRIGLFTDTYPPFINGVSTSVQMLKRSLEKKGHQVYVVTLNDEEKNYKFEEDDTVLRIPGLPIGIYDYRVTGLYPIKAMNIIRKWKLDVIHSHTEFSVGIFARVLSRQFNIPLVHTYHTLYEDYVHYITKGYFGKPSRKIVEYLTNFYCDTTTNELIVPTKKIFDLFKEKYNIEKNIYVIPTGIEIDRFFKENIDIKEIEDVKKKLKIKLNSFNILFVGRLGKEKNVDLLLDAQKVLVDFNKKINLIIVGDGPDGDGYKKKVKDLGIEKNVIFTGKVPWEKIQAYYRVADLFATASTTETQGLTVIEAMAASICPVCIRDESFTNAVYNDLNGKIFDDIDEYIEIIMNLFNNPKELSRLQNQARNNSERYSSKYYGDSVLKVYEQAIENKKYDNYGIIGKFVGKFIGKEENEINSRKSKNISRKKKNN